MPGYSPYPLLPQTAVAAGTGPSVPVEPGGKSWYAQYDGDASFTIEGSANQGVTWATLQTSVGGVTTIVSSAYAPLMRVVWTGGTGNQSVFLFHD